MRMTDLIELKANKGELSKEQIQFIVSNFTNKNIPDYQMAAFLMAVRLNGMNSKETAYLTESMMNSGKVLDWSFLNTTIVDKHSTGGVGDKVSIVLGPLLAAVGLTMAKMSGRGLAQTGGTIDKLETIKGFNVVLSEEKFKDVVKKHKIAIVGQDKELVPADKLIYALRDVTGTVQSIPLIASSIMSKKLATGSNVILLDVKCGSGAFMKTVEEATALGKEMIEIGKNLGRKVIVEITNMQQPLGRAIGNKNEVLEAIQTLKGEGPKEFTKLIYSSGSELIKGSNLASTIEEANELIDQAISSGAAFKKFCEWVTAQGGDIEDTLKSDWWKPAYSIEIQSDKTGYLEITSALEFGLCAMKLGAGRATKEDLIDNEAGIYLNKITNEFVNKGDILFTLYSSKEIDKNIIKDLKNAYQINQETIENPVVLKKIN
ncbi:thymidine phosphorylase [Mycoplasma phocoenae]|uniref:Thymidine phosphorylase n=1 Tax=Mycoplasma phocoenae TaxID=754517 RepID=A0A858U6C2_9MOLU|nr:thymidine phosphorylase [Mycoplasma phocoenae]QJG67007.1 thymidine phosphorylase [Mycoplasma phocoenae]